MTDLSTPTKIGDLAAAAGVRRVHMLAWRDLEDPEAGGSERHLHEVARIWAAAGLDVEVRTSFAAGRAPRVVRDGYTVIRRAGRYLVFPRAIAAGAIRRSHPDAVVEVWNGVPFLTPLWARTRRLTVLHHVHAEMWDMVLPPTLARLGHTLEQRIAPALYRREQVVTLSNSSATDIARRLGLPAANIAVVPPGVDPRFTPGGTRTGHPSVLAVGRLVPVKQFPDLVRAVAEARRRVPGTTLTIVGDGYDGAAIETAAAEVDGGTWVELAGRLSLDQLIDRYRSSWVLASASSHEGWGMSATEAAACGTPSVVTDIPGHRDAVIDGITGLVRPRRDLGTALADLLDDEPRRRQLGDRALARSSDLTWEATALGLMRALVGPPPANGPAVISR